MCIFHVVSLQICCHGYRTPVMLVKNVSHTSDRVLSTRKSGNAVAIELWQSNVSIYIFKLITFILYNLNQYIYRESHQRSVGTKRIEIAASIWITFTFTSDMVTPIIYIEYQIRLVLK